MFRESIRQSLLKMTVSDTEVEYYETDEINEPFIVFGEQYLSKAPQQFIIKEKRDYEVFNFKIKDAKGGKGYRVKHKKLYDHERNVIAQLKKKKSFLSQHCENFKWGQKTYWGMQGTKILST